VPAALICVESVQMDKELQDTSECSSHRQINEDSWCLKSKQSPSHQGPVPGVHESTHWQLPRQTDYSKSLSRTLYIATDSLPLHLQPRRHCSPVRHRWFYETF